jgi:hypothetical protein
LVCDHGGLRAPADNIQKSACGEPCHKGPDDEKCSYHGECPAKRHRLAGARDLERGWLRAVNAKAETKVP